MTQVGKSEQDGSDWRPNPLAPTRMGSPVTSEDLKGHFRRPNREEQRPFIGSFQGKKRLIQEGDLIGVLFSAQRTIHDTA